MLLPLLPLAAWSKQVLQTLVVCYKVVNHLKDSIVGACETFCSTQACLELGHIGTNTMHRRHRNACWTLTW